jgi:hypothetical protein
VRVCAAGSLLAWRNSLKWRTARGRQEKARAAAAAQRRAAGVKGAADDDGDDMAQLIALQRRVAAAAAQVRISHAILRRRGPQATDWR